MPYATLPPSVPPVGRPVHLGPRHAAVAFYGDLFGWTAEDADEEFGGYINFQGRRAHRRLR